MSQQTVVCIAGMHRSGTSMVARLLNLCGVDLGPESELMPATPANPEGYWENTWFFQSNERILTHLRGSWDVLPVFPSGWVDDPALQVIRDEAHERLPRFSAPVWGWKDPRNSILCPFWASLIPGLKVVVCLRNPLEAAVSLSRRGATSTLFGLQLWWQYNTAMLQLLPENHVVTHYDAYFIDPVEELRRVANALGLSITDEAICRATTAIGPDLRHARHGLADLREQCFIEAISQTYCRLLMQAGPVVRKLDEDWALVEQLAARWDPQDWQRSTSLAWHAAYDEARAREAERCRERDEALAQLRRHDEALVNLQADLDDLQRQRDALEQHLDCILRSRSWRLLHSAGIVKMAPRIG